MLFMISFIIAFKKQTLNTHIKKGNKKNKLNTDENKGNNEKKKDNSSKEVQEKIMDDKFIDCGKSYKYVCHIDYTLFNEFNFSIDVVSWGCATKIYTDSETILVRSFQKQELFIVCFTIMHGSNDHEFFEKDITDLFNFTVKFKFSEDKRFLMAESKVDNPKIFYDFGKIPENESEIKFSNVYETSVGVVPEYEKPEEVTCGRMERELPFSVGTFLNKLSCIPFIVHKNLLKKLINEVNEKLEFSINESDTSVDKSNESTENNEKHRIKNKKKSVNADKNVITFNGSQFLIDRAYDVREKVNMSETLPYVAVIYSVKDVFKDYLKKRLLPLSIIIEKIYNLPSPDIRIKEVFLTYSFDGVMKKEDKTDMVAFTNSKIDINHSKVFLLHTCDMMQVIEGIQTGTLLIKVYGICKPEANKIPKVFGQGNLDNCQGLRHADRYNMPLPQNFLTETEDIYLMPHRNIDTNLTVTRLLAYAAVDLSQLMTNITWLRLVCNLSSKPLTFQKIETVEDPDTLPFENYSYLNNMWNPVNINHDESPEVEIPYYKESQLVQQGSLIKIKVKLDVQLQPQVLSETLRYSECYNRLVVITKNQQIASHILGQLIVINETHDSSCDGKLTMLSMSSLTVLDINKIQPYGLPNKNQTSGFASQNQCSIQNLSSLSMGINSNSSDVTLSLTGFLIDSVDEIIIMVEGLSNKTFPKILTHVYKLDPKISRVLFNTDLLFKKRIYAEFLSGRKIAVITLAESLKSLLSRYQTYLEGNIPIPAWNALLKLDVLRKSYTINALCRNNLLPTVKELLSFDLEFGVPIQTLY